MLSKKLGSVSNVFRDLLKSVAYRNMLLSFDELDNILHII
jgi:hypothetical protein